MDSQKEFIKVMKNEKSQKLWKEYLNSINWKEFLRQCDEIPYAIETFLELQKLKILKGFIIRIHSFEEGREKLKLLREKGIVVPIYYVGPDDNKSSIYIPNKKTILLDDQRANIIDWKNNGGRTIIYDPVASEENDEIIKEMDHLLL